MRPSPRATRLVRDVVARTAAIRRSLASVPYIGTPEAGLFVSDSVVERHDALVAALDATDGLDVSWLRLSVGSVAASRMSTALAEREDDIRAIVYRHAKPASAASIWRCFGTYLDNSLAVPEAGRPAGPRPTSEAWMQEAERARPAGRHTSI